MPVEIEVDPQIAWVFYFTAVTINVIGNFIDSIGWCVQKKSHVARLSNINSRDDPFLKDKSWCKGFALHTFGNKFAKISYAFGPASLLLPLDTLKIVWTTFLAHRYLNEKVSIKEIIGIIIILCGAIISTVFGPKPKDSYYTVIDIARSYEQPPFLIAAGFISLIAITDYLMLKFCKLKIKDHRILMLSYILFAAYLSSWNTLFVKQILELIVSSFTSLSTAQLNWTHWLPYITIIALLFTSVGLEYWRQKALKLYDASYVAAIYIVLRITLGIILSALFFREFSGMEVYQLVLFIIGLVLSFIGVGVVVYDKNDDQMNKIVTKQTKYDVNLNANDSESDEDETGSEHKKSAVAAEIDSI